jgi:putative toxin-antitoxin system antitoxin component (TIGR02293 family)
MSETTKTTTQQTVTRQTKGKRGFRIARKDVKIVVHTGTEPPFQVQYVRSKGIDDFVSEVFRADPLRIIATERNGVAGVFVKDLSKRMEIPANRMFSILGVPKATVEKKVAAGELLSGSGGRAALGMAKLLGIAHGIVESSTVPEARGFDFAKWLGQWLEKAQPALGGRKPAELIDTPTGVEVVAKLLGAIESGAYQ